MIKNLLFLVFTSIFFNVSQGQDLGTLYAKIDGQFEICALGQSVTLHADYRKIFPTGNNYDVNQIPYDPPFDFTSADHIPISTSNPDDFWSPIYNLPFDFSFFGNSYNKLLVGSNGLVTFDIVNNPPGGVCPYNLNDLDIPDPAFQLEMRYIVLIKILILVHFQQVQHQ